MKLRFVMPLLAAIVTSQYAGAAVRCTEMVDAASGRQLAREGQCSERVAPMSTFKIAISLMGYDSGILQDEHAPRLPFKKGYADWLPAWRMDTDPSEWMQKSVVWYSQQVTQRLGEQRFRDYVQRFGYGNLDVSGDPGKHNGLSASWLSSSLGISPDEQVAFLRRMLGRELGLKQDAYNMTARLMKRPELVDGWEVYGKTGSSSSSNGNAIGWYVGWATKGGRTVVFSRLEQDDKKVEGPGAGLRARDAFLQELPARLATQAPASLQNVVDSVARPVMAQYDVPGMALAVIVDGKPVFFNYGLASKEDKVPVSEATLFELGSVSKTFTATLATYAQAAGKLSLDDHPGKYMAQLKGSAIDKATLLQLGTYTAGGLPLQFPGHVTYEGVPGYFRSWKPLAAPGAQRGYSNPSIGLLGHVTALALKREFNDVMDGMLFPQLGLAHTYITVPAAAMPDYAWGYNDDNTRVRVGVGAFDSEAYGVKSSAADMARYVQANIDPSALDAPMRRAVEGVHVPYYKARQTVQGLGWEQYPYPVPLAQLVDGNSSKMSRQMNPVTRAAPAAGPTLYNKTGSTNGFGAYVAFVPEKKIGIVMLANKAFPNEARIKLAHAVLEQLEAGAR